MARRREALSLPAVLEALDRYLSATSAAVSEEPVLESTVTYTYVAPSGKRLGVTRDCLEGKIEGAAEWPLVGEYEVDIVDSEGASLLPDGPWKGTKFDADALARASQENPLGGAVSTLVEELRITIRDQRARIDAAERREGRAREELNKVVDSVGKLQKDRNDAVLARDKAVADKDLALERQKEAEKALEALEEELAEMKPQIKAAVDHFVGRAGEALGFPLLTAPSGAETANANADPGAGEAQKPQDFGDVGNDPPPPGADDPDACVGDLLRATVLDEEVARSMYENGILTWDQIRRLVWLCKHDDLGEVPIWPAQSEPNAGAA